MSQLPKPMGILGGTFDPIHFGHCRAALEIYQNLEFEVVRFVPCKQPVHKERSEGSAEQRRIMLEMALANESGLEIDTRELMRDSPSFMIETLQSFRQEFPHHPLCLIVGTDALITLNQWHHWQSLNDYAHILVISRPEYQFEWESEVGQFTKLRLAQDFSFLQKSLAGYIYWYTTRLLDISATEIRKMIKAGKSPRYLLPNDVIDFITAEGLYLK